MAALTTARQNNSPTRVTAFASSFGFFISAYLTTWILMFVKLRVDLAYADPSVRPYLVGEFGYTMGAFAPLVLAIIWAIHLTTVIVGFPRWRGLSQREFVRAAVISGSAAAVVLLVAVVMDGKLYEALLFPVTLISQGAVVTAIALELASAKSRGKRPRA